ncbi:probable serine/threonine-protein kinase DDB_G0286465 [Eurytemora carolleeae]|uniref:probable serine/threonine-protein kinase DDB_G0286465 n=1 Tax=Eurytemora carolleeae TaxID=1294199 RepID=UPI000C77E95B|nr:probable serine/threonine-protein kinase DDB_G0286465 [Eurytemora carolleeae]|eukprot:XP_023323340.1 probable serine/threonine-protein kinase DDB_G0286465 [Eurytemora affinis]
MSEAGLEFDNGNQGENRNNWVGFSKISTEVCNNNNNNNNNTKQYSTKAENDFSNGNNVYDKTKGSHVQDNNSTYDYSTPVHEDNGRYVQDCTPRHKDLSYPSHPNKRAGFLIPGVCSYLETQGTDKVQRKTTSLILNLQSNNNILIAGCRGLNRISEDQGSSRNREDPGLDLTWIPPPLTPDQEMREKLFPDTQSQEFHSFLNQLFLTLIIYFE